MNAQRWLQTLAAVVASLFITTTAIGLEADDYGAAEGIEVQTRGPVHEAFAEVVSLEYEAGIIVGTEPPPPIEELPPEQRPEGENVEWIPGYWARDDERTDFIWISGVWRNIPPDREYVPGYWAEVASGWQWISGYWNEVAVQEVEYLPEPPRTIEVGPNIQPPSQSHVWTPGCWVWRETRYFWRPGYWIEDRPDWVWVPAHYVWAPSGYIHVGGYWDHDVQVRGVLFAPVYYSRPVYRQPTYHYTPSVVIDVDLFTDHLFVRPSYRHYYFGDYYAADFQVSGILPWFSFHFSSTTYDPFFAHHRVRHDVAWVTSVRSVYDYRQTHIAARPPHTFSAQLNLAAQLNISGGFAGRIESARSRELLVASSYADTVRRGRGNFKYAKIDQSVRREIGARSKDLNEFRNQRRSIETNMVGRAVADGGRGKGQMKKVALPQSPVRAAAVSRGAQGKGRGAPPRPLEPGLRPQVGPSRDVGRGGPGVDRGRPDRGGPTVDRGPARGGVDRGQPDRGAPGVDRGKGGPPKSPGNRGGGGPQVDRSKGGGGAPGGGPPADKGRGGGGPQVDRGKGGPPASPGNRGGGGPEVDRGKGGGGGPPANKGRGGGGGPEVDRGKGSGGGPPADKGRGGGGPPANKGGGGGKGRGK